MKTKFLFMEFKTWLDGRIKLYNGDCLEFKEYFNLACNRIDTELKQEKVF